MVWLSFTFLHFSMSFFCTQDDVVSQRHKFESAFLSYFPRSKKLPCFFNFPVSRARLEKLCVFYWLQFRITWKSGCSAPVEKRLCISKGGKSKLTA